MRDVFWKSGDEVVCLAFVQGFLFCQCVGIELELFAQCSHDVGAARSEHVDTPSNASAVIVWVWHVLEDDYSVFAAVGVFALAFNGRNAMHEI